MGRFVSAVRERVRRARNGERFVQYVVGGGVLLVAGLWTVTLLDRWSPGWLVGALLVGLGVCGLALGIRRELDY